MHIINNIIPYIVLSGSSLQESIQHIINHKGKIVFVLRKDGFLQGLMTKGDIMRLLACTPQIKINSSVDNYINRNYISATNGDPSSKISKLLEKVEYVPIVDNRNRLKAVATQGTDPIRIGKVELSRSRPCMVIAEIGINHNGSMDVARNLIEKSKDAGVDCIKFQMRDMETLYNYSSVSDNFSENLGSQYVLDLLSRFQLQPEQMFSLFDYCREYDILPLCTPWDLKTLDRLEQYGMDGYKVASADLTNSDLLTAIANTYKPVIMSTGMSDEKEIRQAVELMRNIGSQFILLHCNSTYPSPFKDVELHYMNRLEMIGDCMVGYSGHERGYHIPIAAVALGAKVIEKHITLDKDMEGNDHKVSLLPEEFKIMIDQIRNLEEAMGECQPRHVTQGEKMNRANLAKSIIINTNIKEGDIIRPNMLEVKSPGRGLQPNRKLELINSIARRNMKAGDYFYPSDLASNVIMRSRYLFKRPWGIPVRYYDYRKLVQDTNPDFLEFHLSYKDMDLNIDDYIVDKFDMGLVVHSPDMFSGDHILDLSAEDESYRSRSIQELQRVIDITRYLKKYFKKATVPFVIVSPGGFTKDSLLPKSDRKWKYEIIADSFSRLDDNGVEVIAQTLPPFPWYFGGQLYLNVFVDPEDTAEFCKTNNRRLCFDISHSKLACNHFHWSFKEFVDIIGPYIAHLHIVDAAGLDNEGLQISEGEVDFSALADDLERLAPYASFIPEVWQGHENNGEGFWIALERLQKWF